MGRNCFIEVTPSTLGIRQRKVALINVFDPPRLSPNFANQVHQAMSNNIPIRVVKYCLETIRPRGFENLFQGNLTGETLIFLLRKTSKSPLHTKRNEMRIILKQVSIKFDSMALKLILLPDPLPLIILQSKDMVPTASNCRDSVEVTGITIPEFQLFSSGLLIPKNFFICHDFLILFPSFQLDVDERCISSSINLVVKVLELFHQITFFLAKILPKTLLFQSLKMPCNSII